MEEALQWAIMNQVTQLKNIGVIFWEKTSTTEAAITKLMYLFGQKVSNNVLKTIFETAVKRRS